MVKPQFTLFISKTSTKFQSAHFCQCPRLQTESIRQNEYILPFLTGGGVLVITGQVQTVFCNLHKTQVVRLVPRVMSTSQEVPPLTRRMKFFDFVKTHLAQLCVSALLDIIYIFLWVGCHILSMYASSCSFLEIFRFSNSSFDYTSELINNY